jgi:hypothetical protein
VRAIAGTSLTAEQRQSLVGLYPDVNTLECIDSIDAIGMQSHYSCSSINGGGTYTANALNSFMTNRMNRYYEYANALITGGVQQNGATTTKLLEVHLTVRKQRPPP